MADEQDQQYKPWLRDSGAVGAVPPAAKPSMGQTEPIRRDVQALSADELLARPAPLPTDMPETRGNGPGAGAKLRDGVAKIAAGLRAANARLEPGRRLHEAAAATAQISGSALRSAGRAVSALGTATANAATQAAETAAPKIHEATDAALAGLSKTAASARKSLGKGSKAARVKLGAGAASAKQAVQAAIPERAAPAVPASELDRLVEREGLSDAAAATPATVDHGLPLFGRTERASAPAADPQRAPANPANPVILGRPAPPSAAAAVNAPPAEAIQAEAESPTRPMHAAGSGGNGDGYWAAGRLRDWAQHPATWILAILALVASGFALGRWTGSSGMSDAALGEAIDAHLLANPQIIPQAMDRLQANRQAEVISQRRAALTTPFSGAWAGNAGGDVTLVVFTDYACTFCRASVPDIERLLRTDSELKIVFRELPILSAESEPAARTALAAARRGRYMAVHRTLFRSQVPDAAARANALTVTGLTLPDGATGEAVIDREIAGNVALARALGIDGTPAFVVGNRLLIGAVGYDQLRDAIATARE